VTSEISKMQQPHRRPNLALLRLFLCVVTLFVALGHAFAPDRFTLNLAGLLLVIVWLPALLFIAKRSIRTERD
jgi:hypothetical protein